MGVNPQTQNNALKPYGLVYELLSNQIPVIWSIKPGKGRGEADFVGPTGKMKGGPFIISSEFAAKAAPIINQPKWAGIVKTQLDWARGNIPVYATLRAQPRWSINGKSDKKALDYFEWADIPDTAYEDDIDPANLNECIDIFIVPHDNIQSNFITSTSIWNAPPSRGFIWFGCESGGTPGDWLSTGSTPFEPDGYKKGSNQFIEQFNDEPPMQFLGVDVEDAGLDGGSIEVYRANWRPQTRKLVVSNSNSNDVTLAYGPGKGDFNNGWVMVSGGDNYQDGTDSYDIAAIRAMFNFSLFSIVEKGINVSLTGVNVNTEIIAGTALSLSVDTDPISVSTDNNTTIAWTNTCGGTFSPDARSRNVNFTLPSPTTETACNIAVEITDACGRKAFASQTLNVNTCQLAITAEPFPLACFNESNGTINLVPTGESGPYTYNWTRADGGSGSGSGVNIANLSAGTYDITLTNADCSAEVSGVLLNEVNEIIITPTVTPASCGLNNGAIRVSATGGGNSRRFKWSTGATTRTISGLAAGTYSVTVTGNTDNSCEAELSINVGNSNAHSITINTLTDVACFGGATGALDISVSGGSGNYSYSWNDGSTMQDRTNLAAGTYTVMVTDDNNDCTVSQSFTIHQPAAELIVSSTPTNPGGCGSVNGGTIALSVSGGTPSYTYDWADLSGTNNIQNRSNLSAGTYMVTVTDANDCEEAHTVVLTVTGSGITVSSSAMPISCNGSTDGKIFLTVSGGSGMYTYNWADLSGTDNIKDRSGLSAATYSVTVTDNNDNSCTAMTSEVISEPAGISIVSQTSASCFGQGTGSIDLTASGGSGNYSYSWNDGNAMEDRVNLAAGTYTVTVTDNNNGCDAEDTFTITQSNSPISLTFNSTPPTGCGINSSNGSITLSVSGGTSSYNYDWADLSGTNNPRDRNGLSGGTYRVTVTDANNCEVEQAIVLSDGSPAVTVTAMAQSISCNGASDGIITIQTSGGSGGLTYNWGDIPGTDNIDNRSNLAAGTYFLTVTDQNGCDDATMATVNEPDGIGITSTPTPVDCFGTATGGITLAISGGMGSYTYLWNDGATTRDRTAIKAGIYSVKVTDANNCMEEVTGIIVAEPTAALSLSDSKTDISCFGDNNGSITITPSGGTSPYEYDWSGNPSGDGSPGISALAPGTYAVTVTDDRNCEQVLLQTITQPTQINVMLTPSHPTCPPDADAFNSDGAISLSATGGAGSYTYAWTTIDGAGLDPTAKDQTSLTAGTYSVVVTDGDNCTSAPVNIKLVNQNDNPVQPTVIIKN